MTYIVEARESGDAIEEFDTEREAKRFVILNEAKDRTDGTYEPCFYAIRHGDECEVQDMAWQSVEEYDRFCEAMSGLARMKSEKKAEASRTNGAKGGRPKKKQ